MSSKTNSILRRLTSSIRETDKRKTSAYDTTATVRRIEGSTAWVHIPGGIDETPVKMTINAQPGDDVQVRVSGGRAFIVGNGSAPPTDDTVANTAVKQISVTNKIVNTVKTVAERASRIAGNTAQYFWVTETGNDTGAHITEKPQEDFLADPTNGGGNLLARSNGIAVRDGLTELATFSADGLDVTTYDSNNDPVEIAHLGYGDGNDSGGGTVKAPYYTLGQRLSGSTVGNYSTAEGYDTTASGYISHTEGAETVASGPYAHAEGYRSTADVTGYAAHAEGARTTASGYASHVEGYRSTASGIYSHAGGQYTKASSANQTAIGKYNVEDSNDTYAFIIGNGDSNNDRSNALTVDWNGKVNGVTLSAGSESVSITNISYSSGSITAYRRGQVVQVYITITLSTATTEIKVIGTLPAGYRPIAMHYARTSRDILVTTYTDGRINLNACTAGSINASLVFVAAD